MNHHQPAYDYVIEEPAIKPTQDAVVWAKRLGYAGLTPFIISVLFLFVANESLQPLALQSLLAYAAVILTFVGALHWTRALLGRGSMSPAKLLTISVIPSLVAWLALLLPMSQGLVIMAMTFVAVYVFDRSAWHDLPWFLAMRRNLTLVVLACMTMAWFWHV